MLSLSLISDSELRRLAYALTHRKDAKCDKINAGIRAKWKFRVRVRLSGFLADGAIPLDTAWRLRRYVPEKCLRRIGMWRLVSEYTNNPLPVPTAASACAKNRAAVPRNQGGNQPVPRPPPVMGDAPLVCVEAFDELVLERVAQDRLADLVVEQVPHDLQRKHIDLSSKVEQVRNDMEWRLADWAISHNITRSAFTSLLTLCNSVLPSLQLPRAASTVLSVSSIPLLLLVSSYARSLNICFLLVNVFCLLFHIVQ